jgi:rfaE bifunctional protein nucleotidyltransferase chain/domain
VSGRPESSQVHGAGPHLQEYLASLRARLPGTIVLASGCFDLLHAGHLTFLEEGAGCGDHLVVALNSDASIRELKGPDRPIVPEGDRLRLVAALRVVDAAFLFDEIDVAWHIGHLHPDVFVTNHETEVLFPQEHEAAARVGCALHLVTRIGEGSTSQLLGRLASE